MDQLVALRKEQGSDYFTILAPFLFKLGDYLVVFVELNTDEFGNVKALPEVCFDSDESSEEDCESEDPREESKDEPVITEQIMTINTCQQPEPEKEDKEEGDDQNNEELC